MIINCHSDGTETLASCLYRKDIFVPADCGGRGTCGKCKVRFLKGAPEPTEADEKLLKPKELAAGLRLACRAKPEGDFVIEIDQKEEDIFVETISPESITNDPENDYYDEQNSAEAVVAVDVGTTTIAAALVKNGRIVSVRASVNHQRSFGADVISRIQASNNGNGSELKKCVEADIRNLLEILGADPEVTKIVVSGNTTMEHLLCGYSCKTLGVSPFTPVDISLHEEGKYIILPGISTYVGADIVSGIVYIGMDTSEEICLLLDLGTNGEMALGNKEKILVASTAAGPAFEGVNISCGVAGIPGAISHIDISEGKVVLETIDAQEPVGICGSGVIDITYELLKEEIIDETGRMKDEYMESGFQICNGVSFSAKDIREVQLAKSAIRAGLETLLEEYGISYEQISKLYLAGGFGQKIDLKKSAGIGLFPKELVERTEAVGNTSLYGAVMYAVNPQCRNRFLSAVGHSKEVCLSNSPVFRDYYMDCMFFE